MTFRTSLKALALMLGATLSFNALAGPMPAEPVTGEEKVTPDTPEQIRAFSLSLWPKLRNTSQQYYTYIRAAADVRAYFHVCTHNDLTSHMDLINRLAARYMQTVLTANYEENEWATLHKLDDTTKARMLADYANDVYAFEYGLSLAAFEARKDASGQTPLRYCQGIARDYQNNYIPLLATARRELNEAQ